eukprot:TRINITY_DN1245_c0_g1_i6.p2 TRINITY_DN1245_c0_g1~~TRINITY_DN1245_c0_g1_i6.p2  ORF type:complete len:305 (-),score=88.46 TRINITY_DN1245_c0_g1_i6:118-1032(-)
MVIEKDARSRIVNAIELEKQIHSFEIRERLKGKVVLNCEAYNELRRKFVELCGNINSVTNPEGKGRDDLSVNILIAAEGISRKVSNLQSRAVRKLAEQIRKSFTDIRVLLRKYQGNIELVDPQLKNNQELVEALVHFERSWSKGQEFFLSDKMCGMLIYFSQLIEGVAEKHKDIQEKIEAADTDIFVMLPCLVVLSSLDGDNKGICDHYYPGILSPGAEQDEFKVLKERYLTLKKKSEDGYEFYNIVEKAVLEKEITPKYAQEHNVDMDEVKQLAHGMKRMGIEMQRYKPSEWNALMETAMGQI